jgi:hypothetical protein
MQLFHFKKIVCNQQASSPGQQKKNLRTYRFFLTVNLRESIPSLAAMQRVADAMSNH